MIQSLLKDIRDLCNHPWKRELIFQDRTKWNKLWASMDAIDDTQLAIDYYSGLPDFSSDSGGFLYIYGLMQALNIQQDAMSNLSNALFNLEIDFKLEHPELYKIREHRNNSTGHPTKRGKDISFHYFSRGSISKAKFTLASLFPKSDKNFKAEEINTLECIRIQGELVENILNKTMIKLQSDFNFHKGKFKGKKLSDLIDNDFHYEFSKLYQTVETDYPPAYGIFKIIKDSYDNVKNGIIDRYFSLSALQGVDHNVKTLDYIFNRLERDLLKHKINDKFELYIFLDALQSNIKELKEMVTEIDKEFE